MPGLAGIDLNESCLVSGFLPEAMEMKHPALPQLCKQPDATCYKAGEWPVKRWKIMGALASDSSGSLTFPHPITRRARQPLRAIDGQNEPSRLQLSREKALPTGIEIPSVKCADEGAIKKRKINLSRRRSASVHHVKSDEEVWLESLHQVLR
jgi:hypothetical protein